MYHSFISPKNSCINISSHIASSTLYLGKNREKLVQIGETAKVDLEPECHVGLQMQLSLWICKVHCLLFVFLFHQ